MEVHYFMFSSGKSVYSKIAQNTVTILKSFVFADAMRFLPQILTAYSQYDINLEN